MQSKISGNVLIVGGAGYVGSHVNQLLCQKGYQTVIFDNLSRGSKENVVGGEFVQGDLGNIEELNDLFKKYSFDAIIHFAALTDVGESFKSPSAYYQENVVNSLNLINKAVENKVKAFVFSSSAAIFGLPTTQTIAEDHPCQPINPYGQTKLIVETILSDYDSAYGLKSCCLRYFNAAGNDPTGKIHSLFSRQKNLIPLIFQSLRENTPLTIYGTDYPTKDGSCIRDYIHVADLAEAHFQGLNKILSENASCHYNLGNGQGYSVKEVIDAVEKTTGLKINVIKGPRRPGDPPVLVANSEKAKHELGWTPKYPDLETIIAHAWKAFST